MSESVTKNMKIWWFIPVVLISGVVNGLLGAGGGVIMMYVVRAVLSRAGGDVTGKDTFATVVAIMLPVSLVSAVTYAAKGNLDFDVLGVFIIPAIAGGILGAYLTDKLPTDVIRMIFAVLVVISGIRMIG